MRCAHCGHGIHEQVPQLQVRRFRLLTKENSTEEAVMFTAPTSFTTVMSAVTFEVVDVMSGQVLLVTRDSSKAARVAAELNSGADRVRIF